MENGNLSIGIQRKLLKAKFPIESILDHDLSNAIQKFKVHTDEKLDRVPIEPNRTELLVMFRFSSAI
jgi:hypothetical protein